jgi:hypothetical protein
MEEFITDEESKVNAIEVESVENVKYLNDDKTLIVADVKFSDFKDVLPYAFTKNESERSEAVFDFINNNNIGIQDPVEPTSEEVKVAVINAVQERLDNEAKTKGYDNGFACASYATSSVPSFKNEAESFIGWRDTCWCLCYDLLEKYLQGSITRPTVDDVLNKLPNMEWK